MKTAHESPRTARAYHRQIDEALNDSFQRRTLDKFAVEYRASRDKVFEEIDGRGLIRRIADMKDDAARHIEELYAQFTEQLSLSQGAMQQLLFPEVLSLSQEEMVLLNQILLDLKAIGFDMEQLSPDSYSILGIPAQLANQSPLPVIQHILHQVRERGADTQREWREQIALTLAEQAAIPYGKILTETEMREIVQKLVQLPQYRRMADGKTVVSLLTDDEISRRFS